MGDEDAQRRALDKRSKKVKAALLQDVTESARACSYFSSQEVQKTYQFWLLTLWLLTFWLVTLYLRVFLTLSSGFVHF